MIEHRNGSVSFNALWLIILSTAAVLMGVPEANAEIYLNEIVVRGTEQVEIYNSGDDPVDLTGWLVRGSGGDFMIPNGTVINPGQYLAFAGLGGIMSDLGAEVDIIDDIKLSRDSVDYGQLGGAPLPHDEVDVSLCRAPDASADTLVKGTVKVDSYQKFGGALSVGEVVRMTHERVQRLHRSPLAPRKQIEAWREVRSRPTRNAPAFGIARSKYVRRVVHGEASPKPPQRRRHQQPAIRRSFSSRDTFGRRLSTS